MRKKRQIASWLLLAVFVPMMLLSSLHIHYTENANDDCEACVNHHCTGHLAQQTVDIHQCVLCQFLTLPMAVAATLSIASLVAAPQCTSAYHTIADIVYRRERAHGLRAPPVVC